MERRRVTVQVKNMDFVFNLSRQLFHISVPCITNGFVAKLSELIRSLILIEFVLRTLPVSLSTQRQNVELNSATCADRTAHQVGVATNQIHNLDVLQTHNNIKRTCSRDDKLQIVLNLNKITRA